MDDKSKKIEVKQKHSKFGFVSVSIGAFNILLFIFFVCLIAFWLMKNVEAVKNPSSVNGMRIPDSFMHMVTFYFIMQLVGLTTGIFGLIEKDRRKLLPIIGIILNGLFLLVTSSKLF